MDSHRRKQNQRQTVKELLRETDGLLFVIAGWVLRYHSWREKRIHQWRKVGEHVIHEFLIIIGGIQSLPHKRKS